MKAWPHRIPPSQPMGVAAPRAARLILYILPLLLQSGDALAWGLHTHVYFAQLLVWSIPLLDPELRRAVARFPHLVMAGACLPDLALVGPRLDTPAFAGTHRWESAHHLLRQARDDDERALAVGFASHLLVDVIAHNHFVPAHEKLLLDIPWLTHVTVEWAMDAHIARHAFAAPGEVLLEEELRVADFAARHFGTRGAMALKAVRLLGQADRGLRRSRLPELCYRLLRLDGTLRTRFDDYIQATGRRLDQLNRVLNHEAPAWPAELNCPVAKRDRLQPFSRADLRALLPLPHDLFEAEPARV
ncbi:MAG TPA: zinc dependent phospholipase C family protein [Thiobacillaceae bacterium]|nr:zinc dependent phospholipase C family protein [Thiobacillaceae bacterium]